MEDRVRLQKLHETLEKVRMAKLGESPDLQRELSRLEDKILEELRLLQSRV